VDTRERGISLEKTDTKYFGQVEYELEDVLTFSKGLFGFEEEKRFLLLPFEGGGGGLLCLQSLQTRELAFVAISPLSVCPDYDPQLREEELRELGVGHSHDLGYYVLCAVKNPVSESTVNLQCPLAVNPQTRQAMQVILETDRYQMRCPLTGHDSGKGEAVC
jgi:flagellar assembly factor FliW